MDRYRLRDVNLKEHLNEIIGIEGIVISTETRTTKKNEPFLFIEITDNEKRVKLTMFDNVTLETAVNFTKGKNYVFYVQVSPYEKGEDGISCVVKSWEVGATDINDFVKWEDGFERAYKCVLEYCDKIKHTCIGKLTVTLLHNYWSQFARLPGAKSFHHIYLGGLLVHTCCVTELAIRYGEFYNEWYGEDTVNMNLLICGALLHDIGKLNEYDFSETQISIEYSSDSILMNHIVSGMLMIEKEATKMGIADRQEVKELIHLIASHHGRLEWGSPVETHCIEADILSFSDQTDASVNRRIKLNKDLADGVGSYKKIGVSNIANYKVTKEIKMIEL